MQAIQTPQSSHQVVVDSKLHEKAKQGCRRRTESNDIPHPIDLTAKSEHCVKKGHEWGGGALRPVEDLRRAAHTGVTTYITLQTPKTSRVQQQLIS